HRLRRRELGRFGDVAAPPDDVRVAARGSFTTEVRVTPLAVEEPDPVRRLVDAPAFAHRTRFAAHATIPIERPGSFRHVTTLRRSMVVRFARRGLGRRGCVGYLGARAWVSLRGCQSSSPTSTSWQRCSSSPPSYMTHWRGMPLDAVWPVRTFDGSSVSTCCPQC